VGEYDAPTGNRPFIHALADLLSEEFRQPVSPRNIAITNGSQSGFAVLFNLFGGDSDEAGFRHILLPLTPEYIGYADVGLGDRSIFRSSRPIIELHDQSRFKYKVDFPGLELDRETAAICLSRPTNPTGNVVTDDELGHLQQLASSRGIPLILDSAYGQPFPGIVFSDAQPSWDENTILCLSLSKLGLPGVRTGIIVADEAVIEMITGANAIFSLAPGGFGPALATRLVASGEIIRLSREIIRPWYRQRSRLAAEIALELMHDLPLRIHDSEGAIFLWFWFADLPISSETLYRRLKARAVYVIAGHHFFPGLEEDWPHRHECIRVSYAADENELRRGLEVIADEVRRAYLGN
jgi:valine--pyruvate aminotransferase